MPVDQNQAIATRSPAHEAHLASLALPNALMGGTPAMIAAGETYLPRGEAEEDADYDLRRDSTVLLNAYKRTAGYLTGQVFARDVVLAEGAEATYQAISENVDQRGNNLSAFSRRVFLSGLHAGVTFILVDFSRVNTRKGPGGTLEYEAADGTWLPKTQGADVKNGWRPYWTHIESAQVIDGWCEVVNGQPRLVHFRFFEDVPSDESDNPWARSMVRQIRVLTPGKWQVYRETKGEGGAKRWELHEEGDTKPVTEIPLAIFKPGESLGELVATPALQDLAYLNLSHWQATSGHKNLMDWMRRPPFFGKQLSQDGDAVPFGPNRLIQASAPDADLRSVAVDPAATTASREDLRDIETAMALHGLQLLMPSTGTATATEKALNAAESDSTLKAWAKLYKDCLEQAYVFTAQWLGRDDAPEVEVNTDFRAFTGSEGQEITAFKDMCTAGLLSKSTLWAEMVRRGMLPESVTPDTERDAILMESRDGTFQGAADRFLNPGAGA